LTDEPGAALLFSNEQCNDIVDLLFSLFDHSTTLPISQNNITMSKDADNLNIVIAGSNNLLVPIDGLDALLQALADASHSSRPLPTWKNAPRHMGLWTKREERELLDRWNRGEDVKRIALKLGRSVNAVQWRLGQLTKQSRSD
jgi:hypothetical protein